MKKYIQSAKSSRRSREDLINAIEAMRRLHDDKAEKFEEILFGNNANEDDSDPNEGFYNTMSDEDLSLALKLIKEEAYTDYISDLSTYLADALDLISEFEDIHFEDDEFFSLMISCHDDIIRAKNKLDKFLE